MLQEDYRETGGGEGWGGTSRGSGARSQELIILANQYVRRRRCFLWNLANVSLQLCTTSRTEVHAGQPHPDIHWLFSQLIGSCSVQSSFGVRVHRNGL